MKNIIEEKDNIAREIVRLINDYERKPCECFYQELLDEPFALSVSSRAGAPRVDEDIAGGYVAEFPFSIFFRSSPDDNEAHFACEQFLNELAAYLVGKSAEISLGEGNTLEELEQTQTATLIERNADRASVYQTTLILRYEHTNKQEAHNEH